MSSTNPDLSGGVNQSSTSLEQGMTRATITGEEEEGENPNLSSSSSPGINGTSASNNANHGAAASSTDISNSTSSTSSDDDDDDDDDDDNNNESSTNLPNQTEDPTTLLTRALTLKETGNEHFKQKEFNKASRTYKKAVNLIKHLHSPAASNNVGDNDAQQQITALLISLQSNLSMVYYKLENYSKSKDIADYIITNLDPKNSKAYYRRGLSHYKLLKLSNAKHDLYQAHQYNPNDKAIIKEYRKVKKEHDAKLQKQQKDKKKQKNALARAFTSGAGGGDSILYNDREEELKKKQQREKEKQLEQQRLKEKRKVDWENDCVERMSKNQDVLTFEEYEKQIKKKEEEEEKARKKAKKEKEEEEYRRRREQQQMRSNRSSRKEDSDDDDDDILTEKELQALRGYKKTSDGRTTSYFNREQTEEEKKLLGSIAPKKLQPATTINAGMGGPSISSTNSVKTSPRRLDASISSSSAWNQAGTWEEKNASEWCNKTLETFLKNSKVSESATLLEATVTKVENLKGDASVAFVSGKKRYVFDYSTDLSYEIVQIIPDINYDTSMDTAADGVDGSNEKGATGETRSVIAKGKLHLPDISSTSISDEEIEVQIKAWKKRPKSMFEEDATHCREALLQKVREQVFAFVSAFNAQY